MLRMIKEKTKKDSGIVMLFAIFLSIAILTITFSVVDISTKEIGFSSAGRNTSEASLAADLGVECALYNDKSTQNKFPLPFTPTQLSNCAGQTPTPTGSGTATTASYDFVISGLGTNNSGCVRVNVFKDSTVPETVITSKGYNIGNASCNSSNPNRLEREYEVRIGGTLTPPSPPLPPGNKGLFYTIAGAGTGTVSSSPSGSSCGTGCLSFSNGTSITLTANAGASSVFTGWGGDCAGVTCNLTMDADRFVTAYFDSTTASASFPTVAGSNSSHQGSDILNHTVALPAGISAGDLLLVLVEFDGNPNITWPGGWTQLFVDSQSSTDKFEGRYRIATGTEGPSITLTTNVAEQSAHQTFRIINYNGVPEAGVSKGSSVNPDSPNLSPSWGSGDTLWISAVGRGSGAVATNSVPANYSDATIRQTGTAGVGGTVDTARRELTASSENPGSFTLASGNVWVAATIAIEGGGGGGATNNPPTANAGTDDNITLPTTSTTLNGSASDTDGTIANTLWSFITGPTTPSIATPSSLSTSVTGMNSAGTYTFSLYAEDNLGASDTDNVDVIVASPPASVTLDATSDSQTRTSTSVPSNASPITWSHTVGSGSGKILVVTTSQRAGSAISSVNYGGTPLSMLRSDVNGAITSSIWYLVNPPTGTNTISVAYATSPGAFQGNAVSLFGVNQSSPVDVHNGNNGLSLGPASVNLTTTIPNAFIIDVVALRTGASETLTMSAMTNRVQRENSLSGAIGLRTGSSTVGPASPPGVFPMSWTTSYSSGCTACSWAISTAAFKP